eukprot:gnl/TRDRNA2_/TRDRNA2_177817_c0_seq26.p1 gnl/TRDRNA2_/TRDRNA2_177817_c0~~gnl/TRDRNA2_/TRDRNA2_177817_c0_seq26.p1  ORF type:complete len:111 (+),score=3.16 gnl/TRDRNA2_/TRDRNA2_177817_c0_seq26:57-389(+)
MGFRVAALLGFLLQNCRHAGAIRLKQAIRALRLKKNVPIRETPLGYQNSAKAAEHTDVRFIQHYAKSSTAAKCNSMLVTRAKENCGGHGCGIVFVGDSIMEHLSGYDCYM